MHQRQTYETLLNDTILNPKDKIALPDREATILRKTQQLSRYDDYQFLDLEKDNKKLALEQAQQEAIKTTVGTEQGGSIAEERATRPKMHDFAENYSNADEPQDPPAGGPKRARAFSQWSTTRKGSTRPSGKMASSSSSTKRPPPPPPGAASSSTQTPNRQMFDMTVDDDMRDTKEELSKVLAENAQHKLDKNISIANQIAQNLGPHSATADQSYVSRLTDLGRQQGRQQGRIRARSKGVPMEVVNDEQQQPPPPPPPSAPIMISGGKASKTTTIKTQVKATPKTRGRPRTRQEHIETEKSPPPHRPPPSGMSEPTSQKGVKKLNVKPIVIRKTRPRAKSVPAKTEPAPEPSKLVPHTPIVPRAKSAPRIPTPPPQPKRAASESVGRPSKKPQTEKTPDVIRQKSSTKARPTRGRSVSETPKERSRTPVNIIEEAKAPTARSKSRITGKQPPKPSVAPIEQVATIEQVTTPTKTKAKPTKKPEEIVKSKITKETQETQETEKAENYPAPWKLRVGEIATQIMRLVKENGFDREDAISVLKIVKEMEGASPSTIKGMRDELRKIYTRNYKAVKQASARGSADT